MSALKDLSMHIYSMDAGRIDTASVLYEYMQYDRLQSEVEIN